MRSQRLFTRGLGLLLTAAALGSVLSSPSEAGATQRSASEQRGAEKSDPQDPIAKIRRTAHGVAHIKARSYRGVGLGVGYAQAKDHLCVLADMWVTVQGRRSLYFGPDGSYSSRGNGQRFNNLKSDFFWQRIKDARVVEKGFALAPPRGPTAEVEALVAGYAAGYNRYLRDIGGADGVRDPGCRGADWVRPITDVDVFRRMYAITGLASFQFFTEAIVNAQPPLGDASPEPSSKPTAEQLQRFLPTPTPQRLAGASNGYALGRQATTTGSGMLLANPHFVWQGSERFHQFQLTIPGRLNVAGASLLGWPLVHIGHTSGVAWTHTTSDAYRFTPYELKLVPGDPTSYLVDGQPRKMTEQQVTVPVRRGNGQVERRKHTFYRTHYGPMLEFPDAFLSWGPATAYAIRDANATNFRTANTWVAMNQAQSVDELRAAQQHYQGIPWVNTIAADKYGNAYYADESVVPNVPDELVSECLTPGVGTVLWQQARLPVLDGSRSDCSWRRDPDALDPHTFGPQHLPRLERADYATNHNDSYWLTNPEQPLTGFARIIGAERTQRTLRTRLGVRMVQERLSGADGLGAPGFTLSKLHDILFNNRNNSAELFRDQAVDMCRSAPIIVSSTGKPVNVAEACDVLARWDLRADLDSRGTYLWQEFFTRASSVPGGPYADRFDPDRPLTTPRQLNTTHPGVRQALADAVQELRSHWIPLDRRWGLTQYHSAAGGPIPIHGCDSSGGRAKSAWVDKQGCFNLMISERRADGTLEPAHGTSFAMATTWKQGRPVTRTILSYSQSSDPTSPYAADQTRLFSKERWIRERFTERAILDDPELRTIILRPGSTKQRRD